MWKTKKLETYNQVKKYLLDILFPKYCLICEKEGSLLCEDCEALIEVSEYQYCLCEIPLRLVQESPALWHGKCRKCRLKALDGLYAAAPYKQKFLQKLIHQFKYEPFIKELSLGLSSLIINHFKLLDNKINFADFILIPAPLSKKRKKERGFNQAEEIAKHLSRIWQIRLVNDVLIKVRETAPQTELSEKERNENIKGAFFCKTKKEIIRQKIFLVDDVYTTGSTMEECAKTLKKVGAKEVWGIAIARG